MQKTKKIQKFLILIICYLLTGCAYLATKVIHFGDIPPPTGPHTVGTTTFFWVDDERTEWYTEELTGPRKMMVQIWYPGKGQSAEKEPYMDRLEDRIPAFAMEMGLPPFAIGNMTNIKANSISDIPALSGSFPVVLFSHGLGGMRAQNTVQAEELASRGYVVVAPDHQYDANVSLYPDNSSADYLSNVPKNSSEEEWWNIRINQLNKRTGDIHFVLDKLLEIQNGSISTHISGKLDLDNIGIFGHSYGGATSIWSTMLDDRIDACLVYDAWFLPLPDSILTMGMDKPFLHLGRTKWENPVNYQNLDTLLLYSKNSHYKLEVVNANHFDFTDIPQYSHLAQKFKITGKIQKEEMKDIMNTVTLDYFDYFLKHKSGFDPASISARFDKLKVLQQGK